MSLRYLVKLGIRVLQPERNLLVEVTPFVFGIINGSRTAA